MTAEELEFRKDEIILSGDEMGAMLEVKDTFDKFIKKSILSLQASLAMGRQKGKEEIVYAKIEGFLELMNDIESCGDKLREYNKNKVE